MTLQQKIDERTAVVGVVGLGYVGLPLAYVFNQAGFPSFQPTTVASCSAS